MTENKLPTYAIIPNIGRCRVLSVDSNGYFTLIDPKDERRLVHRDRLIFLPERGRKNA